MRWTLGVLLLVACGGIVLLVVERDKSPGPANTFTTALASSEDSDSRPRASILANGTVEGSTREILLRFEVVGPLKSVDVQEGSRVRAGDTLAQLVEDPWVHALAMAKASLALAESERIRLINGARSETRELAEAQVEAARARASQAHRRLERGLKLYERNAVTQQELDDLSSAMELAQSELDAADARAREVCAPARFDEVSMADAKIALEKAKCAQADVQLGKTKLAAPCDGIILRVQNEPGELVGPDSTEPCLAMVETQRKRVRAYVEEMDAPAVFVGQRAYCVADGMPDHRYSGKVIYCAPSMVPKRHFSNAPSERVDVKVREVLVELDEDDGLVIGLPVDVFISTSDLAPDARTAGSPRMGSAAGGSEWEQLGRSR
jgi:multidrug resistance efflux pump